MDLPASLRNTQIEWQKQVLSLQKQVGGTHNKTLETNMLVHFFLCALSVEFVHEFQSFLNIAERVIRQALHVQIFDPRLAATRAVKNVLRTEAFPADMLSRIKVEDVRNVIVSELWRKHAIVVDVTLSGEIPSNIPKHVKEKIGTVKGDAQDMERLLTLLKLIYIARRVVVVRGVLDKQRDLTDPEIDTVSGYWWKCLNLKGTSRAIWEFILDIAQYSCQDEDDVSI